ncbi:hypothetical protein [Sulfoacidibacillus ferrooxidans]|uniref:Uncharacterized protein n=1 Tax=Sulfoacidibacillus ferrooxidans TaxID=2005001 RepID=A0A9X1VCR5_9BACL|nr:hypothetical protein [Sulfoacidibacillus ferrooxidans]MCI0184940.1 hypothetical protein [Sulfoacidibacillus ferrooxidans]
MLDVQSPVPLTEGETIAFGVNTKQILHFVIGLGFSAPIVIPMTLLSGWLHMNPFLPIITGAILGLAFAAIRWRDWSLAELILLSIRFMLRPKLLMYDREYRVRIHAQKGE